MRIKKNLLSFQCLFSDDHRHHFLEWFLDEFFRGASRLRGFFDSRVRRRTHECSGVDNSAKFVRPHHSMYVHCILLCLRFYASVFYLEALLLSPRPPQPLKPRKKDARVEDQQSLRGRWPPQRDRLRAT